MNQPFPFQPLQSLATSLLLQAGLNHSIAATVAEVLLEGDLLGKRTHGLQLLSPYLKQIEAGNMTCSGSPAVINQSANNLTLDANYLPGPWIVRHAIDWALPIAKAHGIATVAISKSHHIACLQAYLKPVTDRGCLILLTCSDPSTASVAPYGGTKPVFTPNPIAIGIPTTQEPILIDISASTTTNGRSMQLQKHGQRFPCDCLLTPDGRPTNDPAVLFNDPAGTIMPLGGLDFGHKGFALAILVETLTSALAGFGRSATPDRWGASVFIQLINPSFFAGTGAFLQETDHLSRACHAAGPDVRLPGEQALALRNRQLKDGVELSPDISHSLNVWAEKLGVESPLLPL